MCDRRFYQQSNRKAGDVAMGATFTTTIVKSETGNATGLQVPAEIMATLTSQKKLPVSVSIAGYTYRSTIQVMDGKFMLPLSAAHREAAGVKAGEQVEVTLEPDLEPRTIDVPDDLMVALSAQAGAVEAFAALPFSKRKEFVRQVVEAKAQETRARRIVGIVAQLSNS
jgi:uncharacterized protein YdeI (YjbR/CyaY-like superfamily)